MRDPTLRCRPGRGAWARPLALALLLGCTSVETRHRDWSGYDGPGAGYFALPDAVVPDPVSDDAEPFNRAMYAVNDVFMRWLVAPVSDVWRFVVRPPARRAITRFGLNLAWPVRTVNHLLQGEWSQAGRDTGRFVLNTSVGVLGFYDPATLMGVEPSLNSTARSLESAGWVDPGFLELPPLGPTSTRDGAGYVGDQLLHPATWISPLSPLLTLNELSDTVDEYRRQDDLHDDAYESARFAWSVMQLGEQVEADDSERGGAVAAGTMIESVLIRYADPAILERVEVGRVQLPGADRELPYDLWLQPEPAPWVCLVPDLGGHRSDDTVALLAAALFERGFTVVSVSSALEPEFATGAMPGLLPGIASVDAEHLRAVLAAVDAQLVARTSVTGRVLVGLGTGGYHALLLAAGAPDAAAPATDAPGFAESASGAAATDGPGLAERASGAPATDGPGLAARASCAPATDASRSSPRLALDGVVAVGPPPDLLAAFERLDAFAAVPRSFPERDRDRLVAGVFAKLSQLQERGPLAPGDDLPLSRWQAEYLVGLRSRLSLAALLFDTQLRHDRGVLLTELDTSQRGPAYREIVRYSLMEYLYAFVLPALGEHPTWGGTDLDGLLAANRLDTWSAQLARRDDVRVIADDAPPRGDVRLDPRRLAGLVAPAHLTAAPLGDDLGQLWRPEIQALLAARIEELLAR